MILRIALLAGLLLGILIIAIAVNHTTVAAMPIGSVYLFVTGISIVIVCLVLSIVLAIFSS
jgi:hypothetical protein